MAFAGVSQCAVVPLSRSSYKPQSRLPALFLSAWSMGHPGAGGAKMFNTLSQVHFTHAWLCHEIRLQPPLTHTSIQGNSEVYIHLSQIHLNSVFHNSWHLILVKMYVLGQLGSPLYFKNVKCQNNSRVIYFSFYLNHTPSGSEVYIHSISIW